MEAISNRSYAEVCLQKLQVTHKKPCQTQKLLAHLLYIGTITPLTALEQYGIYRLSARINDLRTMGIFIDTNNYRTSGGATVAEYKLREEVTVYVDRNE